MRPITTPRFNKDAKKLFPKQKAALDKAISAICANPKIGDQKVGDLTGVFVYKFKYLDQEWLIAYRLHSTEEIKLLTFGTHENFYRDLKWLSVRRDDVQDCFGQGCETKSTTQERQAGFVTRVFKEGEKSPSLCN